MRRRVIFHIGLEKTGTTSFQRFCADRRAVLVRHGLLYPRYRARRRPNHAAFAASYLAGRVNDPSIVRFAPRRDQAVRAVRREIDGSSAPAALISAEHLSSRFDDSRTAALAADFADRDVTVLVVVRDLHARFLSAYGTAIGSGGRLSLDDYADEVLNPSNPYLDIAATLTPWRRAFGAERLTIVDYDAADDVIPPLLRACGLSDFAMEDGALRREKPALPPDALRVLRLCNAMLHDRQGRPEARPLPIWAQHTFFSNACRRALAETPRTETPRAETPRADTPAWTVGERTLERLDRVAAAERRWLLDQHGLATRGSDARTRIRVAEPSAPSADDLLRARALVERVTRPFWPLGDLLVGASLATRRLARS